MNLFNRDKVQKFIKFVGVFTVIATVAEGWIYYESQKDLLLKFLLIFQNTFQAFLMRCTITLTYAIDKMPADAGLLRHLILYAYAISQVLAPIITATALYRAIELFFRRFHYGKKRKGGEPIIIFGYNEFARNLILSAGDEYRPYVKPGRKLTSDEELELLRNRITIFQKADEIKNVLGSVKNVILADKDIAADLGVLLDIKAKSRELEFNEDCRYHIYYDDPGDRWLSEKVCRTAIESEDSAIERATDIEFFDLNEIAARKAVKKLPFWTWQEEHGWQDKNFHMLLVGFGYMGQQVLLKAMNQAVFASDSNMIFDVVDLDVKTTSGLFFNQFRSSYVKKTAEEGRVEYTITDPQSDGKLIIRLHEVDCRLTEFKKLLGTLIEPANGIGYGSFTYGMICLSDNAASIQALMGVHDMIRDYPNQEDFPVCIRVNGGERENLFKHVKAALPSCTCVAYDRNRITLEDILQDDRESAARNYNWMYNNIGFRDRGAAPEVKNENRTIPQEEILKKWLEMEVFQKDSSRALYEHKHVKEALIKSGQLGEVLEKAAGENGTLLSRSGNDFVIDESHFLEKLSEFPQIEELMKTEHRRWNYFMATQGWTYKEEVKKKDPERKIHPCMTNWEILKKEKPETCKYDLMTYLMAKFF